jgi:hypothetical protein
MLSSPVIDQLYHVPQPTICKMGNSDPTPTWKIWADELQRSKKQAQRNQVPSCLPSLHTTNPTSSSGKRKKKKQDTYLATST